MSTTIESAQRRQTDREAAISRKIDKVSRQQNITPDSKALQVLADYAVNEVQQQKSKLDERRKARAHFARSGHALQRFMSTLSQFMKASGLSEVAKGVDVQYGGLVTGALSILVQLGENKEGHENAITAIFEELTKGWIGRAGRLTLYSKAFPNSDRMEALIADVYLGIGELAIESAEYDSRPPYARFWQAIRRPPSLGINLKADEIKKAVLEVVFEGSALHVHSYVHQLAQQKNDQLAHMAKRLGIGWELADSDKMIAQCKALHADAFAKAVRRKGTKQLQQISLDLLRDFHLYKSSKDINESSVLILSGSNFDLYEVGLYLYWLSPVTTEIAEVYRSATSRVWFHSACRNEATRSSNGKEPFDVCLSRFIIEILRWDDEYFSQNRQFIEDEISDSDCQRGEMLRSLLKGWDGSDEVCIIIDRLDWLVKLDSDRDSDEDEVSDLLKTILEIVSTASCKIRLVVTVDASRWPQVRKDADLEERSKIWRTRISLQPYTPFYKIDWQQSEILNR